MSKKRVLDKSCMKITLSTQIKNIILAFIVSIFCCMAPSYIDESYFLYSSMIGINSFLAAIFMLNDSTRPYTLNKIVNFFILIFFVLANAIQLANHSNVLTFYHPFKYSDFLYFQFLVFAILIIYNLFYKTFLGHTKHYETARPNTYQFPFKRMLIVSGIATVLVFAHYHFNFYSLFFRGLTRSMMNEYSVVKPESGSIASSLIFGKVIRAIPWGVYILSCCSGCSRKQRLLLFIPMLLTVFPTGLSRNAAAIYWVAVIILNFEKKLKRNSFIYVLFIGIFIVFPFLNNFRFFSGKIDFRLSYDFLDSMHMDASQIFMASMSVKMVTWGRQLLGALLFFVPRIFWPSKPAGSGHTLVTSQNGFFTNVSCPFFAEGYINFGFVGIFVFVIFLAFLTGWLDGKFWRNHSYCSYRPLDGFYLIMLGSIIFIMRGDLMSSFAFTIGTFIAYYIVMTLSKI